MLRLLAILSHYDYKKFRVLSSLSIKDILAAISDNSPSNFYNDVSFGLSSKSKCLWEA